MTLPTPTVVDLAVGELNASVVRRCTHSSQALARASKRQWNSIDCKEMEEKKKESKIEARGLNLSRS